MKCAVAIVLALIGMTIANPEWSGVPIGVPPKGLNIVAPLLVPTPAGVGYKAGYGIPEQTYHGIRYNPVRYRVLAPPLSFALPAIGYNPKYQYSSWGGWEAGWGQSGWH